MKRQLAILFITLMALSGSLIAARATASQEAYNLRGYADPITDQSLPYRLPRSGINVALEQYDPGELDAQFEAMQRAGFIWIRQHADWSIIESERGQPDWSQWDQYVETIRAYPQLKLFPVLINTPAWARDPRGTGITTPANNPADFAAFVSAFAERYGESIEAYQIWDEPNLNTSWGLLDPQPADYLALLSASYSSIHAADAQAVVLAASLAPTSELGPQNISDWRYLDSLYALGLQDVSDGVSAKPYGFASGPQDRQVSEDRLNFSRIVRLREIMLAHGDGSTPLWASHFGWNSLPTDWTGAPSIWGEVSADEQRDFTMTAIQRAETEWPWLGGMILYHWQPDAPSDDPVWGFSLHQPDGQPTELLEALNTISPQLAAQNGLYPPRNPYAQYSGVWTFGELGADIGWVQDSQLTFEFTGSDVALWVRKDNYVAYLYPTVDGQPGNVLPRDAAGNAYLILTSGDRQPETALIPVARSPFSPTQTPSILRVITDRGSDRWALMGFAVSSGDLRQPYQQQIQIALITALVAFVSAAATAWSLPWRTITARIASLVRPLQRTTALLLGVIASVFLMIGMLLTWGQNPPQLFRREPVQLVLAILSAGLIYLEPGLILTGAAAVILWILFYHRPVNGLSLVLFWAPFFMFPVELYVFSFPTAELLLIILFSAWLVRMGVLWAKHTKNQTGVNPLRISWQPLDLVVAAWVALGFLTLLWSERRDPAITELRTMILEPALFYLIWRTTVRQERDRTQAVDAFLIGGVLVAVIGLWLYLTGQSVITAEAGAGRLASVYGSPNNVGLYLGRCLPFVLAFTLSPANRFRRGFYAAALVIMLITVLLTQSAGALFIGVPFALAAVFILTYRRRALLPIGGITILGAAAAVFAMQSARFARLLQFDEGTNFYRLRVWESAVNILRDHPITGLGLDQFLYAFRGTYILPDAWQEPDLSHPHNLILDVWVRLGVLGVIWLITALVVFFRRMARLYRQTDGQPLARGIVIGAVGCMVNLIAHGLVDNSIFVQDLCYVFVLLLALASHQPNIHSIDAENKTMV